MAVIAITVRVREEFNGVNPKNLFAPGWNTQKIEPSAVRPATNERKKEGDEDLRKNWGVLSENIITISVRTEHKNQDD